MKKNILVLSLLIPTVLSATVGSVIPGQSLWGLAKRIGQTSDVIESKIDQLLGCAPTEISTANISGGEIIISSSGAYQLVEDVIANISITGSCVALDLNSRRVTGVIFINGATDVSVENGFVDPPPFTGSGSLKCVQIDGSSSRVLINRIVVTASSSTVNGYIGISVEGGSSDIQISNGTFKGGDAGALTGASGGDGIQLNAVSSIIVRDCIIQSGAGGSAAIAGGNGGHGIDILSTTSQVEIDRCIIMGTGAGGDSSGDVGGDGGDGIRITSDCSKIAVHDSIIRNTGVGGTGTSNGANGKAVNDDVTKSGSESLFMRNFAHAISNQIKYDLQATNTEQGTVVGQPPGNVYLDESNQFVNAYMTDS